MAPDGRFQESILGSLFDHTAVAIFALDLEGNFVIANKSGLQMVGLTESEIIGKHFFTILPVREQGRLEELFGRVIQEGESFIKFRVSFLSKKLEEREVELSVIPHVKDDCVFGAIGTVEDITDRLLTEKALNEALNNYHSIFRHTRTAKLIIDPTDGSIVDANDAACSYYGYPLEQMKRLNIGDINILSPEEMAIEMRKARKEERKYFIFQHKLADGQIRDVEVYSGPVTISGKEYLYSIIHDITERKQTEKALMESEERFRSLVNSIDDIVFTLDTEQRHSGVYGRWLEKSNLTPEMFLGKTAVEILGNEASVPHVEANCKALKGESVIYEWWREEESGRRYFQTALSPMRDHSGRIFGLVGIGRDITLVKAMQEKIERERNKLFAILDTLPAYVYLQSPDYSIAYANKFFVERFGDPSGKTCYRTIHGRSEPCETCPTFRVFETKNPQIWVWEKDHDRRIFMVYDYPYSDQDGREHVLELGIDITEQKKSEQKLAMALEEKEFLIKEVNHRVKNSLAILQSLVMMQASRIQDESTRRQLEDVTNRIRTMAQVHGRLYQAEDVSHIEIAEYITSLVTEIYGSLVVDERTIGLELDLAPMRLPVDEAIPCGLIINELLTNALKYAFPLTRTGVIRISFQIGQDGERRLHFSDNGVGFPSVAPGSRSVGLGMKIIEILVSQLEGSVTLESECGTIFTIVFPENKR